MATDELIKEMTLEEKCALLSGGAAFATRALPRLGIPRMRFSDGPHGLRLQAGGENHLGLGENRPATCFPTASLLACSWDTNLAEQVGQALGQECLAEGVEVLLGPGLNIKRSPLGGRNFEYFSEDPLLSGKMAAASVRGIQSSGVAACPKHFAANSQETLRMTTDSVVDERTLREIYLAGFETVVRKAKPRCLMTSYNLVNGTYANENDQLLQGILRKEWGYTSAIVTDWGGSNDHVEGVKAGSTFQMPGPALGPARELMAAVLDGRLPQEDLDARVGEALDIIFATTEATRRAGRGQDSPTADRSTPAPKPAAYDMSAHHQLACKAAASSFVLLKNEEVEGAKLLPLAPGAHLALIGDFARKPRYQGAGSSCVTPTRIESLLDVLLASPRLDLVSYNQGFERDGSPNDLLAAEAVAAARTADVALVCLGLDERSESEGADRTSLTLPACQIDLVRQVVAANPRTVVLLSCGSVVETGWMDDVPTALYLGLSGQAGALAIHDILVGATCPSGKLAETWPKALSDTPTADAFPAQDEQALYKEGPYVGYRYYQTADVAVAFPFGHGLSYATFAYDKLSVAQGEGGAQVHLALDLTNTSATAGSEVVQVYLAKRDPQVFRPAQELIAFAKVTLGPQETRQVEITLDQRAFSYFNVETKAWEVEGGLYEIRVGASSEDIRLVGQVELEGTCAPNPYAGRKLPSYTSGQVASVPDEEFFALLGRKPGPRPALIDRNLCFRNLDRAKSPLLRGIQKGLAAQVEKVRQGQTDDINAVFVWNMPLRALATNVGEVFSMSAVDGLVMEAKGLVGIGLARTLAGVGANVIQNALQGRRLVRQASRKTP